MEVYSNGLYKSFSIKWLLIMDERFWEKEISGSFSGYLSLKDSMIG